MNENNILLREATYDDKDQIAKVLLDFYNMKDADEAAQSFNNDLDKDAMKKGIEKGARVINGLKMLRYQAEKSWELWSKSD